MNQAEKLIKNWSDGSSGYTNIVLDELAGFKKQAWTDLILRNTGQERKPLEILDVGAGPGFFAIIMTQAGHKVTAVDCTEAMIDEARGNAGRLDLDINFRMADSHQLDFSDESFDLVISRNVAWTLLEPEEAYLEWRRVLRPGGRTLIFDANWNIRYFNSQYMEAYERDLEEFKKRYPEKEVPYYSDEMIEFRKGMPMCQRLRPQWDLVALIEAGYSAVSCDTRIWREIYDESEQIVNRSTPMFMLTADR